MSDFSTAMKSAAIYLYERKGKSKEEICGKFSISRADLAEWLLNREDIKREVADQLACHYTSAMLS